RSLDFLPDIYRAVTLLDTPARDGVERRRAHRFAGAQAEAGMMPRTAHGFADEETLGQRAVVVRALGAHRQQLLPAARQQHRLASSLPEKHGGIGNLGERHSLRKIGAIRFLFLAHETSSRSVDAAKD